jgi:curved DNA-binding protein
MTNYYQTLGVSENASPEEIKKAYRSLANKHHPDKGGDQAKFKDISVAYDTLGNANKKAEYDMQRQAGPQVRFHTGGAGFQDFGDIFNAAGFPGGSFGDIFGRRVAKNRDLNIQCKITLLDSYQGKQLEANYQLPSGKQQTVVINLPAGVMHGDTIRYQGLGDDSFKHMPAGHLNVTIIVLPDNNYQRVGDDLYTEIEVNPIEAIIGCRKPVKLITGKELTLDIRAGIETGAEFASPGQGFTNPHTKNKGRFVSVVRIKTPIVTDPDIIARLTALNDEINKKS